MPGRHAHSRLLPKQVRYTKYQVVNLRIKDLATNSSVNLDSASASPRLELRHVIESLLYILGFDAVRETENRGAGHVMGERGTRRDHVGPENSSLSHAKNNVLF